MNGINDLRLSPERQDLKVNRRSAFQKEYLGEWVESTVLKTGSVNRLGDMYSEEAINRMYSEWRDKVSKRIFSKGTNISACLMGDL